MMRGQQDFSPAMRQRIDRLLKDADRLFSLGGVRQRCQGGLSSAIANLQPSPFSDWGALHSRDSEFQFALTLTMTYQSTMPQILQWAEGCMSEFLLSEVREERERKIEEFARMRIASRWYQMKDDDEAWRVFSKNIPFNQSDRVGEVNDFFELLDHISILTDILTGHASEYGLEVDYSKIVMDDAEEAEIVEEVKSSGKRGRPRKTGRAIQKSFVYRALTDEETNQRLQFLYNGLKQLKWIAADTLQKNFLRVFSGEDTSSRVVWTGDINTLVELFRELVQRKKYVQLPEGESIWVMVNARFWEKEGNREFGNERLAATRSPLENKDNIDLLVRFMNPQLVVDDDIRQMNQSQY